MRHVLNKRCLFCSNAWALEWTTSENPHAGSLITFAQYVIVTLAGLPGRFTRKSAPPPDEKSSSSPKSGGSLRLKPLRVPVYRWIIQVVLFLGVSLLNNAAFGYKIPMAIHIVFRSGGLVVNMILGYLTQNKRYSLSQVVSVVLVSIGIGIATSSGAKPSGGKSHDAGATSAFDGPSLSEYSIGLAMLTLALVLSTFLGFSQEKTYGQYGNHWEEGMFFLHFLALPMFSFVGQDLVQQIKSANASTKVSLATPLYSLIATRSTPNPTTSFIQPPLGGIDPTFRLLPVWQLSLPSWLPGQLQRLLQFQLPPPSLFFSIPSFWIPLGLNVVTQLVCVSGVNRLTSRVSSLTVVLVLALRKAVSLIISVILIGKGTGNAQLWGGSAAVLAGTVLYSLAPKPQARSRTKEGKEE